MVKLAKYSAAIGISALALIGSCGEAMGPREHRWREVASFDGKVNALAVTDEDIVYCAGAKNDGAGPGVIYRFAGSEIEEFFVSPYEEGAFYALDSQGVYLWAGGSKTPTGQTIRPYLVRYDGRAWKELDVPASVTENGFTDVFAVAENLCWLNTGREIYTYENGVWQKRLAQSGPRSVGLTVSPGGRAYALFEGGVIDPWLTVYISDDRGETWVTERPELDTGYYGLGSKIPPALTTRGESLCLGEQLGLLFVPRGEDPGTSYDAVIGRDDAPPGEGSYDIEFIAPNGPYFYNIRDMAFRDEFNGYVVGTLTSVALDNGQWIQEVLPESLLPHFEHVAAGRSSFWAVASSYGGGQEKLYRAP
jgi:hypothetical protein